MIIMLQTLTVIWKFQLHLKMEKKLVTDTSDYNTWLAPCPSLQWTILRAKNNFSFRNLGSKTQVQMQDASLWISVSKQTGANVAYNCSWWSLHIKLEIKASSCILMSQRLWNFTVYENTFHDFLYKGEQLEHNFHICIVCGCITATNCQLILNSF